MGFFKEIAGLEEIEQFEIEKVGIKDVNNRAIPGVFSVQRTDTAQHLGVVKKNYRPIQMSEMLDIIDTASKSVGNISHTGWASSRNGSRIVIKSKLDDEINVDGDVVIPHFYSVIDNSGMGSNKTLPSTQRIACDNALHLVNVHGNMYNATHNSTFDEKVSSLINKITANVDITKNFTKTVEKLKNQKFTFDQMVELAQMLIPLKNDETQNRAKKRDKLIGLFSTGMGNVAESRWDALNAVTEYETHSGKQSPEKFLRSFGKNTLSHRAHAHLAEFA